MRRIFVLVCVLGLLAAACGGDDGSSEATSPPDDDGSVAATAPPDSEEPSEDPPDDEGSDDGGSATGLPPGGTGTVTIDGETIESEWVGNCMIDEQFDPHPDDLDLTAALGGGIQALFLEINNQSIAMGEEPFEYTQLRVSMQLRDDSDQLVSYEDLVFIATPDGTWYDNEDLFIVLAQGGEPEEDPMAEPPMVLDGNNINGSVTFPEGPVVSFDLEIADPVDCSL